MLVKTTVQTTATTDATDDEILTSLNQEVDSRLAAGRFKPRDAVTIADGTVTQRLRLLRDFGVVLSYDPSEDIARVVCVDVNGMPVVAQVRGAQVQARS